MTIYNTNTVKKKHPPRDVVLHSNFYMALAWLSCSQSKDPYSQQGAALVQNYKLIALSSNNNTESICADQIDWRKSNKNKFTFNALKKVIKIALDRGYTTTALKGSTIYLTYPPSCDSILEAADSNIETIVYYLLPNGTYPDDWKSAQEVAKEASLTLELFHGNISWLRDEIRNLDKLGVFMH